MHFFIYLSNRNIFLTKNLLSFVRLLQIPGDLTRAVKNQHDYLRSLNLRLQPMLVFVGPTLKEITASYIQTDNIIYLLRTPLAALDVCFKSFFAFDALYPEPSRGVWQFIQRFFFDLKLKEDNILPSVTSVICSLKGLLKKRQATSE